MSKQNPEMASEFEDSKATNQENSSENNVTVIDELQQELEQTSEQNSREYYLQQARNLRLNFPNNIPTSKLIKLVGDKLKQIRNLPENNSGNPEVAKQFEDMRALVRIKIHVLNPAKQNWTGEIFTVGNDVIPHITRFVPFNAVDGIWHVERIFVEFLKGRKYQNMVEHSGSRKDNPAAYGVDFHRNKLLPEFSIEELPPLTIEELEELGAEQAINGSLQDN